MPQQSQTQKTSKNDDTPQVFNDLLKSLGAVFSKLYKEHSALVILTIFIFLTCGFLLFRTVNISYLYSLFVTSLFIILAIGIYVKEKSFLSSIVAFSLGTFTAFTVTWNGSTFSIFFVSFIVLVIFIFFIASVQAAAKEEEIFTTAASSYLDDFATSMKDLKEVYKTVKEQGGLLSIGNKQEAILFFAYQKVPKDQMIMLIEALNFIYTMTKLDPEMLLTLLNNMYCLSHTSNDFVLNKNALKLYILKGKSTPKALVNILNDTLHIAIENDIDFISFTDTVFTYLSRGYTKEGITEQLSKKFTTKTPQH